jgi:hypothetical protein
VIPRFSRPAIFATIDSVDTNIEDR